MENGFRNRVEARGHKYGHVTCEAETSFAVETTTTGVKVRFDSSANVTDIAMSSNAVAGGEIFIVLRPPKPTAGTESERRGLRRN